MKFFFEAELFLRFTDNENYKKNKEYVNKNISVRYELLVRDRADRAIVVSAGIGVMVERYDYRKK